MIIFNEKEYALKMLQDGYIRENKKLKDIFILAKFFKYQGITQLQACKEVLRFINKFDDTVYSELKRKIKKYSLGTVKNVYINNYTLRFDVKIELSELELQTIGNLNTNGEKQVLFVLLVMSKFFANGTNTFYVSFADIFRCTGLYYDRRYSTEIINKLINNNYIELIDKRRISRIVNTYCASLYQRNYLRVNLERNDNIIYCINSFDNLLSDFAKSMKLIGQYFCESCGVGIIPTNNRQQYCDSCWKEHRNAQNRKKSLKYYYKNKNFTT